MDLDTVRYSVPHRHVRETVAVVVGLDHVEIWLRGACIARHARCPEPHSWVRDPAHFQGLYRPDSRPTAAAAGPPPDPLARPLLAYTLIVEGGRP